MLSLRNLENDLKKINSSKRKPIYHDAINNNLIIFFPCDKSCDEESICNGITDKPYNYLINKLNNTNNTVVFWYQVEGTTSDYTIIYKADMDNLLSSPKDIINKVEKYLSEVNKSPDHNYKYTEVIDDVLRRIQYED